MAAVEGDGSSCDSSVLTVIARLVGVTATSPRPAQSAWESDVATGGRRGIANITEQGQLAAQGMAPEISS